MVWPAIIGAAAVIGGAAGQSKSAKGAARAQQEATAAGIAEQRRQFDLSREDFSPYRATGQYALERLIGRGAVSAPGRIAENFDAAAYLRANPDVAAAGMDAWTHYQRHGEGEGRQFAWSPEAQERLRRSQEGGPLGGELDRDVTAAEVTSDPGYQFGMEQGQQALDRKIAAMGGRVSGASLKAAARFGTDYASTGYNAAYQRRQDRLNRLAALARIGQTATGNSAAAGANATNAITGLITNQGDATAAARMAQGNIWAGAGNQLAALYDRYASRPTGRSSFRYDDPYRNPGYVGGEEGE